MIFKVPPKESELDITGERYVTHWNGQIELEHYHRYLFAAEYCENKIVLDIASGEGYGSFILMQPARKVCGVDVDSQAVDSANKKYSDEKITFQGGCCEKIPFEDNYFDVVVSFETLEHISQDNQVLFFKEIKRVLKPDGLLIMSSPETEVYGFFSPHNPFHIHEITKDEFKCLVTKHFRHHHMLSQNFLIGSLIQGDSGDITDYYEADDQQQIIRKSKLDRLEYLICIASDASLPQIHTGMYLDTYFNSFHNVHMSRPHGYAGTLERIRCNLQEQSRGLQGQIERLQQENHYLQVQNDLRQQKNLTLQKRNDELLHEIRALQKERGMIFNPRSWRFTKPLRFIMAIVRPDKYFISIADSKKEWLFEKRQKIHSNHPVVSSCVVEPICYLLKKVYRWLCRGHKVSLSSCDLAALRSYLKSDGHPLISVIVPNYNHGEYLPQRIDGILNQTFKDFEVLLLDDCSTDGSRVVLDSYAKRFPEVIRTFYNNENSGNVFSQWKKGLGQARGRLVWIAESDDFCESDFLEKLVGFFADDAVRLAYAYPEFVDDQGRMIPDASKSYFSRVNAQKWQKSYLNHAYEEITDSLGVINTIPNASCCLFRKPKDLSLLDISTRFRLCGDWAFYLTYLRGWKIAFTPETRSYFRLKQDGVTGQMTGTEEYYQEHYEIARLIFENYQVDKRHLLHFQEQLHRVNRQSFKGVSESYIESLFARPFAPVQNGSFTVMIATMGFFLGGGEIQPIRLANALKKRGCQVLFFSLDIKPRNPQVRGLLSSDIPVYCPHTLPAHQLHEFLRLNRINVINTHGPYAEFYFSRHLKNTDNIIIATMHGGYEAFLRDLEFNELGLAEFMKELNLAKKSVAKWIYIADNNLRYFVDTYAANPSKFVKISNGFEMQHTDICSVSRKSLGIPQNAFVCICCSRAIEAKGWRQAVQVVNQAREAVPKEIHLVLLGNGPVYEEMKSKTLPSHIHVLGFKDNVMDYLAISDTMLFPTYFEGESVPLSIIESLFLRKPVLSTQIGDIPNMLRVASENPAGIATPLTPEGKPDIELLTAALVSVVMDTEWYARLSANTVSAIQQFDMDACVERYLATFTDAAAEVKQRC